MGLLAWLVLFGVGFGALAQTAGAPRQRRPRFWRRVVAVALGPMCVLLPLNAVLPVWRTHAVMAVLGIAAVSALMLVPPLLYRRAASSTGEDEDDSGGGGSDDPPPGPRRPDGGLPLPDADQSRARVRDHTGPRFAPHRERRPTREPTRIRRQRIPRPPG